MKRTLTLISAILLFSGLYAQTWTAMGTSGLGTGTQKVKSIAYDPNTGTIYAGGDFAGSVSYIAKWNNATSQWENLGTGISGAAGTIVNAVCYNTFDHNLYVGGYFTTAGGIAVHNVAKWNGTAWSAVGAGIGTSGQVVNALYVSPTSQKLYACGTFANDGTGLVTLPKVALFDGAWVGVGTGLDGGVSAAYSLSLRMLPTQRRECIAEHPPTLPASCRSITDRLGHLYPE